MMKVIAFDPGVTTGFAIGTIDESGLMKVKSGQEEFSHHQLWGSLVAADPNYLVWESFEYRNQSRAGLVLYSVELIGIFHLFCKMWDIAFHTQTAATGKGYYSNEHLKKAGVYLPGLPHAMDATRHLLQWFTFGPGYKYNKEGFVKA